MVRMLIAWAAGLVSFCAIDFAWLGMMGPRLYRPALGDLVAANPRLGPAAVFYAVYVAGMVYFAVGPAFTGGGWRAAFVNGALLGLLAYATYDLTNQATLRIWPMKVTVLDVAWGGLATGLAAAASYAVTYAVTAWGARAGG